MSRILVDVHEGVAGVPRNLQGLGYEVERVPLAVGDYVVARGVIVERKTIHDLHLSVIEGRFWRQIGMLRRAAPRPYLLVEGVDLDRGSLAPNAVRGVIPAVLEQQIVVLRSTGVDDSALWLARLAERARIVRPPATRPVYDQRPSPSGDDIAEAVLAAIPGISVVLARRLLARFGPVANVLSAGPEGWAKVEGVGPVRAAALSSALFRATRPQGEKLPVARSAVETTSREEPASLARARQNRGT